MQKNWQEAITPEWQGKVAAAFLAAPCSKGVHILPAALGEPKEATNRLYLIRLLMEALDIVENGDSQIKEHEITYTTCNDIRNFTLVLENLAAGKPVNGLGARIKAFKTAASAMADYYMRKILVSESAGEELDKKIPQICRDAAARINEEWGHSDLSDDDFAMLMQHAPELMQHGHNADLLIRQGGRNQKALLALYEFTDGLRTMLNQIASPLSLGP